MPIPPGSLFSTGRELVNVPVQLLYSRRKLFEKIVANVAKRKLENQIQATGDRMAVTPQQFGMQIGQQTKKAFVDGALIGAGLGAASAPEGHVLQNAGRGMVRGIGTQLGALAGGLGGGLAGGAAGGGAGAATGALLSLLLRKRVDPRNLIAGLSFAGGQLGGIGGLGAGLYHGGRAGYDAAGKFMGPASYTKKAFMGAGALAGMATAPNKEEEDLSIGRGALRGAGTALGIGTGAMTGGALGGLGGAGLGALLAAMSDMRQPYSGAPMSLDTRIGAGAGAGFSAGALAGIIPGAIYGGYKGNKATKALLDKTAPISEKKKKEETKEAFMGAAGRALASGIGAAGKAVANGAGNLMSGAAKAVAPAANAAGEAAFGSPLRAALTTAAAGGAAGAGLGALQQRQINNQVDYQRQRTMQPRPAAAVNAGGAAQGALKAAVVGAPMTPLGVAGQVNGMMRSFGINKPAVKPSLLNTASNVAEQVTGGSPTGMTMPQQRPVMGGVNNNGRLGVPDGALKQIMHANGQQFGTFKPNVIPGTNRVDNRPEWARKTLLGGSGQGGLMGGGGPLSQ